MYAQDDIPDHEKVNFLYFEMEMTLDIYATNEPDATNEPMKRILER